MNAEDLVTALEASWPARPEEVAAEDWQVWMADRQPLFNALGSPRVRAVLATRPDLTGRLVAVFERDLVVQTSLRAAMDGLGGELSQLATGRSAARVYRNAGAQQSGVVLERA